MTISSSNEEKDKGRIRCSGVKRWLVAVAALFVIIVIMRILVWPPNMTAIAYFKMTR